MVKRYTIITGSGRAGTTLLVRVLGRAGLDVGFDPDLAEADPVSHAGLELDLRTKPDCYIVKSPWIAKYIDQILLRDDLAIDHAIICIRDLHDAAESRRRVQAVATTDTPPGGLWETSDPANQEEVLAQLFYRLMFHLTERDVPMTFLHFPRFAYDPAYFVDKLSDVFRDIEPRALASALRTEMRPELINEFDRRDAG